LFKVAREVSSTKNQSWQISDYDVYSFIEDLHYHAYKFLGAQKIRLNNTEGYRFVVWAPNASAVFLLGDFNQWHLNANPLTKVADSGLWELWMPGAVAGDRYQYAIYSDHNSSEYKLFCDPLSLSLNLDQKLTSVLQETSQYSWSDAVWIADRETSKKFNKPINILRCDLSQFLDQPNMDYQELANYLLQMSKTHGVTHVLLENLFESIKDLSLGLGPEKNYYEAFYFSPAMSFGAIDDFKALVDLLHQNRIAVFLKLPYFQDEYFPVFGGFKNLSKKAHKNFFISNLTFWLEEYHIDGFHLGNVENILQKYQKQKGAELCDFLCQINDVLHRRSAGVLTIAEDLSAYPGLTKPIAEDGMGFDMKVNSLWKNEIKKFIISKDIQDFVYSSINLFSENYLLDWDFQSSELDFEELKILLGYFSVLPAKKITNFNWLLPTDKAFLTLAQSYYSALAKIYLSNPIFYENDFKYSCTEWVAYDNKLAVLVRFSRDFSATVIAVMNFSEQPLMNYRIGVPSLGLYLQIFNSESENFAGTGINNADGVYASKIGSHSRPYSITVDLAAKSFNIFKVN